MHHMSNSIYLVIYAAAFPEFLAFAQHYARSWAENRKAGSDPSFLELTV